MEFKIDCISWKQLNVSSNLKILSEDILRTGEERVKGIFTLTSSFTFLLQHLNKLSLVILMNSTFFHIDPIQLLAELQNIFMVRPCAPANKVLHYCESLWYPLCRIFFSPNIKHDLRVLTLIRMLETSLFFSLVCTVQTDHIYLTLAQ